MLFVNADLHLWLIHITKILCAEIVLKQMFFPLPELTQIKTTEIPAFLYFSLKC